MNAKNLKVTFGPFVKDAFGDWYRWIFISGEATVKTSIGYISKSFDEDTEELCSYNLNLDMWGDFSGFEFALRDHKNNREASKACKDLARDLVGLVISGKKPSESKFSYEGTIFNTVDLDFFLVGCGPSLKEMNEIRSLFGKTSLDSTDVLLNNTGERETSNTITIALQILEEKKAERRVLRRLLSRIDEAIDLLAWKLKSSTSNTNTSALQILEEKKAERRVLRRLLSRIDKEIDGLDIEIKHELGLGVARASR